MNITVVGLGKIGLPLAVQYAMKGGTVFGADINQQTVDSVNQGIEPFPEEESLQKYLSQVVQQKKLSASTNTSGCVAKSEVVVVVVPLFVNENAEPDFWALDAATIEIAKGLQKGTLVVYETTLPVGSTRNRFSLALEKSSGLKVGKDFHVAFSPERVLTGRIFSDLRKYPKIVGGVTSSCTEAARKFYSNHLDFDVRQDLLKPNGVWILDSCESAEFVKLAETTYRDVNIALANQFALFAGRNHIDVYQVIEAANSQHFSNIHSPGISVGGHCIPVYPKFYLWNDPSAEIVQAARSLNESMPLWVQNTILEKFPKPSQIRVLVLGASYRESVKETYNSGALQINKLLDNSGYLVYVWDPLFSNEELGDLGLNPWTVDLIGKIDCVVIANRDDKLMPFLKDNLINCSLIIDGRNFLGRSFNFEGVPVVTLGLGTPRT
jgi:nucleotide sugar dehydrogenase